MTIEEIANTLAPKWRKAFIHFVKTGEASQEFLNRIDKDKKLQAAIEQAFSIMAKAINSIVDDPAARRKKE